MMPYALRVLLLLLQEVMNLLYNQELIIEEISICLEEAL